ncbi:hypothetical protein ACFLQ2_00950 [archaeon]
MIQEKWAGIVDSLADKGVPLYLVADPLDDHGIPSWAVLAAIWLVLVFGLVFVLFPGVKYSLDITTTPGAKVLVTYDEAQLTSTAETGTVSFKLPLGAAANVKITMAGCEGESLEVVMIDHYEFEKELVC